MNIWSQWLRADCNFCENNFFIFIFCCMLDVYKILKMLIIEEGSDCLKGK